MQLFEAAVRQFQQGALNAHLSSTVLIGLLHLDTLSAVKGVVPRDSGSGWQCSDCRGSRCQCRTCQGAVCQYVLQHTEGRVCCSVTTGWGQLACRRCLQERARALIATLDSLTGRSCLGWQACPAASGVPWLAITGRVLLYFAAREQDATSVTCTLQSVPGTNWHGITSQVLGASSAAVQPLMVVSGRTLQELQCVCQGVRCKSCSATTPLSHCAWPPGTPAVGQQLLLRPARESSFFSVGQCVASCILTDLLHSVLRVPQ